MKCSSCPTSSWKSFWKVDQRWDVVLSLWLSSIWSFLGLELYHYFLSAQWVYMAGQVVIYTTLAPCNHRLCTHCQLYSLHHHSGLRAVPWESSLYTSLTKKTAEKLTITLNDKIYLSLNPRFMIHLWIWTCLKYKEVDWSLSVQDCFNYKVDLKNIH